MASLVEVANYVDEILRLDLDTPVKGFDGTNIGPANEQAQVLANRTKWLKEKLEGLSTSLAGVLDKEYVASVNKKTGDITILYGDVGAAAEIHTHKPSDIETDNDNQFTSAAEKDKWNNKQDVLVSGTTLKTLLGYSLLGEGNITIKSTDIETSEDAGFVSDDEKKAWSKKQEKLTSGISIRTLHSRSLLGSGDITLTYSNVGADKEGAGEIAVANHVAEDDPHSQYLTADKAKENFVNIATANKANGYLKLDETGNIPADLGELFQVRYIIVDDKTERLASEKNGNITICLQIDENTIYYLDALKEPSVEDNWKEGKSTEVSEVYSVFGRSGIVKAQTGDYDADMITETDSRTFVSADDRKSWNDKQKKLESGVNIKTVNKESLLGSTDIEITPGSIGAAIADHTHTPDEIKTDENNQFVSAAEKEGWDSKMSQLVSGKTIKTINGNTLLGSGNVELTAAGVGAAPTAHKHTPSDIETTDSEQFVSSSEKRTWNAKQEKLVSGQNIKSIAGTSILGYGQLHISSDDIDVSSSKQFVSSTQISRWEEKQDTLKSGKNISRINGRDLITESDVYLTAKEVGADSQGTAKGLVDEHVSAKDPHTQYLNETRGNGLYVAKTTANKANGYLQLDSNGMIPAELGELFKSRYITVENKAERLALEGAGDITICLQTDENRVYYLNPDLDPKEETNWKQGRDVGVGTVISVFGRSGDITAKEGDYKADQITETDTRTFVSDTDRASWDSKQDELKSGTNIRTINKESLLGGTDLVISPESIGAAEKKHSHTVADISTTDSAQFVSAADKEKWNGAQEALESGTNIKTIAGTSVLGKGNIDITPESIGAAPAEHKHTPDEIETDADAQFVSLSEKTSWNAKQDKLTSGETLATVFGKNLLSNKNVDITDAENLAAAISSKLKAGDNIAIKLDEESGLITISSNSLDNVTPTIIEIENAIGGRGYRFRLDGITFNSDFKIFKHVVVFEERNLIIDYTDPAIPLVVNSLPENDENGYYLNGKPDISIPLHEATEGIEKYITDEIDDGLLDESSEAAIMVSENTLESITPIFTSAESTEGFTPFANSTYGSFNPWKAFQGSLTDGASKNNDAWSANEYWNNRPAETFLGIKNTASVKVTGYALQHFTSYYWGTNSSVPTAWDFQGRNEDTDDWTTLDSQTGQKIMNGELEWATYRLKESCMFKQYRLLINAVDGTGRTCIPRFTICNDVGMLAIDKYGRYLAPDDYGDFKAVEVTDYNTFRNHSFNNPARPLTVSLFKLVAPVRFCTLKNIPITIRQCKTVPAIGIQNPIYPQLFWDGLLDINPVDYFSENADEEIKYAVTADGTTYHIYTEEGWKLVGEYTNDDDSAIALIKDGMTGKAFYEITKSQWWELLSSVDEPIVGIAFGRNVVSKNTELTPKKIEMSFEGVNGWEVVSFDKVNVRFTKDFIIFNPVDDGRYKFSYKFN